MTPNVTVVTGYYTKDGDNYTEIITENQKAAANTTYYKKGKWVDTVTNNTTTVNLTGGTVNGDVYGGGLGRQASGTLGGDDYLEAKAATEYGDVTVTLNGTQIGTGAGRVFGANNINGTPKGHVKVVVNKTTASGQAVDVAAVFGGGNQAAYDPYSATENTEVEINMTSGNSARLIVGNVFGGGNEAGTANSAGTEVKIIAGNVKTGVYGGCNSSGTVSGDTKVSVTGGTIGTAWENQPQCLPWYLVAVWVRQRLSAAT